MKKRILTLALAVLMMVSMALPAFAATYTATDITQADLPDGWTLQSIGEWNQYVEGVRSVGVIAPGNDTNAALNNAKFVALMNTCNMSVAAAIPNGDGTIFIGLEQSANEIVQNKAPAAPAAPAKENDAAKAETADVAETAAPVAPAAPETPAGGDTVYVAGQNRTPGQIQRGANGTMVYTVNYGDTLSGLAERFYGDGTLWTELYAVNEDNLLATSGKIIFVGFNLIVPNQLDGVRSNIG